MVVIWLTVHYTPGGAHQSEYEAQWNDSCLMGDDTKYAVIWPETEARLSQWASLNDSSFAFTFPDGIRRFQVSLEHFLKQYLSAVL